MTPEIIGSIIRAILTSLGAGLVTNGYVTADQLSANVNTVSGAVIVIATLGWSIWQKKKAVAATPPK